MAALLALWAFVRGVSALNWSLLVTIALVAITLLLSAPVERGLVFTSYLAVGLSCFHLGRAA